jgi:uncharacterized protein YajQ (UPF0234 family)
MPSFDIISKVDPQQLDNAVNTVKKELLTRYDLKGSSSSIEFDRKTLVITLTTEDHLKLDAIEKILLERSTKQKINVQSYDLSKEGQVSGKALIKSIPIKQGIDRETAKKIVKAIKDSKMKVQPQIMDDMVRVTGKKIDELQSVMSLCREGSFGVPLQFENMK